MKKLVMMFEDLWVAITFAEAGVSETVFVNGPASLNQDAVCVHTDCYPVDPRR
jgi:hypothetical protein